MSPMTAAFSSRNALLVSVCLWLSAITAGAQGVSYLTLTPSVIPPNATGPIVVEAEISGSPSRVTIDFNPAGTSNSEIALRDDGAAPDRRAGDRIYSARLPIAPIVGARTADDANRVFIGYLNVFSGEARLGRYNLFVDLYTPDIGEYPITRLSQFVQATTRVVNIHDASYFASRNPQSVIREFYRSFPDDYDVLNLVYMPQRFENRTHTVIKNTIGGIGLSMADASANYGSAGRLLGLSQFPIAGFYDGAETGFLHELGHQWVNHLRVQPLSGGVPHWPYSSMASGIMGFSIGGSGGQGGNFPCVITEEPRGFVLTPRTGAPAFNDLDLYLMGLLPAHEVRDQFVFADQSAAAQQRCAGEVYGGAMTRVRVDDVVAALGPRVPAFGQAPTTFRTATILVTRDGLAAPETMWFYSWMTERAEWRARVPTHSGFAKEIGRPFYLATGGRGSLQTSINLQRADFTIVPGSATVTVAAGADARYEISAFSVQSPFDREVALACDSLPVNGTCVFEDSAITPGNGGRTTVLTIGTAGVAPGTHVVIVSGRAGGEKHSTAVTVTVQ